MTPLGFQPSAPQKLTVRKEISIWGHFPSSLTYCLCQMLVFLAQCMYIFRWPTQLGWGARDQMHRLLSLPLNNKKDSCGGGGGGFLPARCCLPQGRPILQDLWTQSPVQVALPSVSFCFVISWQNTNIHRAEIHGEERRVQKPACALRIVTFQRSHL